MQFEPCAWALAIEREMTQRLRLVRRACPPGLEAATGPYKGQPAQLAARVYQGGGLAYARFVTLRAGEDLTIANVLAVGHPRLALPVFGADLVRLGACRPGVLAADSWPPDGPAMTHDQPSKNAEGPAWWRRWSSPAAVLLRVAEGEAREAYENLSVLTQHWMDALAHPRILREEAAAGVAARTNAYLQAHREEDQSLSLLAKIFDEAFASAFISQVMFPPLTQAPEAQIEAL